MRRWRQLAIVPILLAFCVPAFGGGGGENMLLIVNPNDQASLQVANAYAALRDIPANNILFLQPPSFYQNDGNPILQADVTGGTGNYFSLTQVASAIASRGLTNQINYIGTLGQAVSYNIAVPPAPDNGLPGTTANSLDYALNLLTPLTNGSGLTLQGAVTKYNTTNSTVYAATSGLYQDPTNIPINGAPDAAIQHSSSYSITYYLTGDTGVNFTTQYYMAGAIGYTGTNGNTAAQVIASLRGAVAADGTHPTGTVYFENSGDQARSGTRAPEWPATESQLTARGVLWIAESGVTPLNRNNVIMATTGSPTLALPNGSTYLPGSWADNLTSYGCYFPRTDQTHATAFIAAGAAGTTGTVIEPYAFAGRFTNSSIDTFIADGLTLGEAFAKSVAVPDVQMPLGDMLAQPYADVPAATVTSGPGYYGAARGTISVGGSATVVNPHIAGTVVSKLELLVDGAVNSSLATAGSSAAFSLNTTGLSDGVHELRIVAINSAQAASEGYTVEPIVVNNHGRSINFSGGNTTLATSAATINLTTAAGDGTISQIELTCLGRVVAQIGGAAGALSLSPSALAPGDNVIVPVIVFSDSSQVAGGAFTVHVESASRTVGGQPSANINSWINATGTGLWSNTSNWSGGTTPQNGDAVARFGGAGYSGYPLAGPGGGTVTLDSVAVVEEIDFDSSGGRNYTLAALPGQSLILSSSNNGPMSQTLINVISGNHAISAPLTLASLGNLVTVTGAADSLTISGSIGGIGALTKTGSGTLVLNGADSYSGATTISGGALQIGAGGANGSLGSAAVIDNAVLLFSRSDTYTVNNTIGGTGSLAQLGPGTLVLASSNAYTGTTNVDGGMLSISGSANISQSSGLVVNRGTAQLDDSILGTNFNSNRLGTQAITLRGGALNVNFGNTTGGTETLGSIALTAGDNTFALGIGSGNGAAGGGALSRAAGATIDFTGALGGSNRVVLSGMPSGSNFINAGTFVNGADYAVYDANGYVRAMTTGINPWDYATTMTSGRNVKLTTSTTLSGTPLTLDLSGSAGISLTLSQSLAVTKGGVLKGGGGTATIAGGGALWTAGQAVEYVIRTDTASDQLAINMPITGGTGFTKSGQGTLVLGSSAISYGGTTTIDAGTLRTAAAGAIPATSPLAVGGGAALDLAGKAQTVAGITLNDGSVQNSDGLTTLTLGGIGGRVTYAGVGNGSSISGGTLNLAIGGSVSAAHNFTVARGQGSIDLNVSDNIADGSNHSQSLVKAGGGILQLSGTNSYSGGTQITGGTLSLGSNAALPSVSDLTITAGALNLGGYANSATAITLQSGQILGNGTLSAASYNLQSGSVSGSLAGSGMLSKTTAGTVVLGGSDTYTGGTTVSQGTLVVLNPWSIPGGNLSVGSSLALLGDPVVPAPAIIAPDVSLATTSGLDSPATNSAAALSAATQSGVTAVPEPASLLLLLATGACGLFWHAMRRSRS